MTAAVLLTGCGSQTSDVGSATSPYVPAAITQTTHFVIHSSATSTKTQAVSVATEILYKAYIGVFPVRTSQARFEIVLYKDQLEFKRNNRTHPWAEAYYLMPRSFAYPGSGANPHHWMTHEITHQLLFEASGYRLQRWLNEGVATYFSSSELRGNALQLGAPDPNAYPIWWLTSIESLPNGDLRFQGKNLVSLQELVEGTGPAIGTRVNNYYIASWSLVHFLMQGEGGRFKANLLKLIERGGLPADFKQLIGDYAEISPRWHAHLIRLKSEAAGGSRAISQTDSL